MKVDITVNTLNKRHYPIASRSISWGDRVSRGQLAHAAPLDDNRCHRRRSRLDFDSGQLYAAFCSCKSGWVAGGLGALADIGPHGKALFGLDNSNF